LTATEGTALPAALEIVPGLRHYPDYLGRREQAAQLRRENRLAEREAIRLARASGD